jgi:3D (Asp-Asp-Asp) domain-containing protein
LNKNILLLLFLLGVVFLLAWAFSTPKEKEYEIKQVEVIVKEGDTLWEIAEENCPSQDPRKIVYQIKQENELERTIKAGDRLTIPREVSRGKTITVEATAYTHTGNHTATGTYPKANHTIAVDPDVIPLGSQVMIGGQAYIAEDTGGLIKGYAIDIFMDSPSEAIKWGRKELDILVME